MPRFEVVGIGRETGKKRVHIYEADNKEAAIAAASADGTIVEVDKIRQLPEIPATESQKQYAENLGIEFSSDISKLAISRLIDVKLNKDFDQKLINQITLSNITPSQMVEELYNRNLGAILITFEMNEVDFKNFTGAKFNINRTDNLTETEMQALVITMGYQYAKAIEGKL